MGATAPRARSTTRSVEGSSVSLIRVPRPFPTTRAAVRAGVVVAAVLVEEEARRIALHIAPIAAVADVELVVIGGGIGLNGDLLLAPVRERLAESLPYPPRVEVSSLGDAAVLQGALAIGLDSALDAVFENRQPAVSA